MIAVAMSGPMLAGGSQQNLTVSRARLGKSPRPPELPLADRPPARARPRVWLLLAPAA